MGQILDGGNLLFPDYDECECNECNQYNDDNVNNVNVNNNNSINNDPINDNNINVNNNKVRTNADNFDCDGCNEYDGKNGSKINHGNNNDNDSNRLKEDKGQIIILKDVDVDSVSTMSNGSAAASASSSSPPSTLPGSLSEPPLGPPACPDTGVPSPLAGGSKTVSYAPHPPEATTPEFDCGGSSGSVKKYYRSTSKR